MLSVDLPVSLNVSLRLSPLSRLIPLKEASCAVVVICAMILLYWLTRLARMACEEGSATGVPLAATIAAARQVGSRTHGANRGGHIRLWRVTHGRLQHLARDRLRGIDQLLQRGDAGIRSLQDLHAVADAVEQIGDVAGAVVETLRGEEVGRVVERRVDLPASGKTVLRGGKQIRGGLQREQGLANRSRKNKTRHG